MSDDLPFLVPNGDPQLEPNPAPERSLVETLNGVVDDLRQLYTDFGLRPYRVFSVSYRWSGGLIGRGEPEKLSEVEILPTPKLLPTLRWDFKSAGVVERGTFTLSEISARYTEEQVEILLGGVDDPAIDTFIEITLDARDSEPNKRRRFAQDGVATLDAENFQWTVQVTKSDINRTDSGQVSMPKMRDVL